MPNLIDRYGNELEALPALLSAGRDATWAYSWEGEDILAWKILHDQLGVGTGFYVDVGAHHPSYLSNTFLFYQRGWRGINIDAMPGSMEPFRIVRPEDLNLEIGIAREASTKVLVQFDDPSLNGFLSEDQILSQTGRGCTVLHRSIVECVPLTTILDRYEVASNFDLLNIDVEGLELEVLSSIDFTRYRPKLIIGEALGCNCVEDALASPIARVMKTKGYKLFSRLHFSMIFIEESR